MAADNSTQSNQFKKTHRERNPLQQYLRHRPVRVDDIRQCAAIHVLQAKLNALIFEESAVKVHNVTASLRGKNFELLLDDLATFSLEDTDRLIKTTITLNNRRTLNKFNKG